MNTASLSSVTKLLVLSAGFWLQSTPKSSAIMADPNPFEWTQPDGSKIKLRLRGDEFFHWREDMAGFTVLLQNQEYVYARLDSQNQLAPTTWQVGRVDPRQAGLTPHLLPSPEARASNLNHSLAPYRPWAVNKNGAPSPKIAATGTVKN